MSLLKLSGLAIAYGGIQAVKGIELEVSAGELVCLIGANGAGKTSTLNCLGGLLKPAAGRITYQGQDLAALPAHERVRRGLALVPAPRTDVVPTGHGERLSHQAPASARVSAWSYQRSSFSSSCSASSGIFWATLMIVA